MVSDKWMDAPLEDSEIWGQEPATIWRRGLKITRQPSEAQQNEKLSFTALSHHIDSLAQPERGVGVEEENVAAVIQSMLPNTTVRRKLFLNEGYVIESYS